MDHENLLKALHARQSLSSTAPHSSATAQSKWPSLNITSTLARLQNGGQMAAFMEFQKEEDEKKEYLAEMGMTLEDEDSKQATDKPKYAYLIDLFDERVHAAKKMQAAFRKLQRQSKVAGWPSAQNPYHWIHFKDVRKKIGWSREELFDKEGKPRLRTDAGRAPKDKNQPIGGEVHSKYLDTIGHIKERKSPTQEDQAQGDLMTQLQEGLHNRTPIDPMAVLTNYQQRHKGKVPFGGDPNLLRHLQEKGSRMDYALIGNFLADKYWRIRQKRLKEKLDRNPLKSEFKEGSLQYNQLKRFMMGNGHGNMMLMHNPLVRDLKATLNFVPANNKDKIMGLLCQFNNVLQYKQGTGQKMVINRHVQGMYDWVMQDVAKQYKDELELARRWAVTPPEPPEGLGEDVLEVYDDVMRSLTHDQNRICRLRQYGRRWCQAFDESSWKRRRIIRTRSAGNLGLLGPSQIDPASVTRVLPVVGDPETHDPKDRRPKRPHTLFLQLMYGVEKQAKRKSRGRLLRPLHCINTAWMGGVDWETIACKVLGRPLPGGVRAPPPPSMSWVI